MKPKNKETQLKTLSGILRSGRTITRKQAIDDFGIGNLPARIKDLRSRWTRPIAMDWTKSNGKRFGVYRIA